MLAAVIERPGAVVVRLPPGEAAQAQALAEAAHALALAASGKPEQLKIVLDAARP